MRPKQKVPSFIRWTIKALFLPFIHLDLLMQYFARLLIRPPYKRGGHCLKRGACCHTILMENRFPFFSRLHLFWQREINGFYLKGEFKKGQRWIPMGCRYLQKNGRCKHHFWRPVICRKWPVIAHFGLPKILKGCGFHVMKRNKKRFFLIRFKNALLSKRSSHPTSSDGF